MSCRRPGRRARRVRRRGPYKLHKMIFVVFGVTLLVAMSVVGLLMKYSFVADHKFMSLVVVALFLWGAAGAIAHRLVRPLSEVARVARAIGEGDLASRVDLGAHVGPHRRGEIGELADAINDMAERIEKQISDQRALLAAVSHEIRTPLGHMRVISELARTGDLSRLAELESEISDVDTLVDQLLASSRIEFDTVSKRDLDAVQVCVRALERADVDAARLEVDDGDTSLQGDAMLLTRAVGNLIENAERHGGGVHEIRISADAELVRIAVLDRGQGFDPDDLSNVFQPFYRGRQNARASHGSLGLGLALVRRIAEAHQGRAWASNTEQGARVTVELSRRS